MTRQFLGHAHNGQRQAAQSLTAILFLILSVSFLLVSSKASAGSAPPPADLRWTGNVSTDFLDQANWQIRPGSTDTGALALPSPFFLFNANLYFEGVSGRNCVFAPPKGEFISGDGIPPGTPGFDFRTGSLFVNSITLAGGWTSLSGGAIFEIRSTEQCRFTDGGETCTDSDGFTPLQRDRASIATNGLTVGGGTLRIQSSSFSATPSSIDISAIAELVVSGPVTMNGGTISLEYQQANGNIDDGLASLNIVTRRDMNGNALPGDANRGNFIFNNGTLNFQTDGGNEVGPRRRAVLAFEGDWRQSGGSISGSEGVVSFINSLGGNQTIDAAAAPNRVATFPALQITDSPVTLGPDDHILCSGAFREIGDDPTSSLILNSQLTLQGRASKEPINAVQLSAGLSVGPEGDSALNIGDNREVDGGTGQVFLAGGTINVTGIDSSLQVNGTFVADATALLPGANAVLNVTGTNALFSVVGWDVVGGAVGRSGSRGLPSRFDANFADSATLRLTGGFPSFFRTTGDADVDWPNTVEWGSSTNLFEPLIAQWENGPFSGGYGTVRILETVHPLSQRAGEPITVQALEIEANGALLVINSGQSVTSVAPISNLGLMLPQNGGKIIGPPSFTTILGPGGIASEITLGEQIRAFIQDSDKNLDGTVQDFLRHPDTNVGLARLEIISGGAVSETELLDQTTGVRVMQELGNSNFEFYSGFIPVNERVDNAAVADNDGVLLGLGGEFVRLTYDDPNGDQTVVNVPIQGDPAGVEFPDLIIENFDLQVNGQMVTYSMDIVNQGTGPSDPCQVGLFADRQSAPVANLIPDFTIDVPRIFPDLSQNTLNLIAENDDSPKQFPLSTSIQGSSASLVDGTTELATELPDPFQPLSITNAASNFSYSAELPFIGASTSSDDIEFTDTTDFNARAFLQSNVVGASLAESPVASAGTDSLQVNLPVAASGWYLTGAFLDLSPNLSLSRTYTDAEMLNGQVQFEIDVFIDTATFNAMDNGEAVWVNFYEDEANAGGQANTGYLFDFLTKSDLIGQGFTPGAYNTLTFANFEASRSFGAGTSGFLNIGAMRGGLWDAARTFANSPGGFVRFDNLRITEQGGGGTPAAVIVESSDGATEYLRFDATDAPGNDVIDGATTPGSEDVRIRVQAPGTQALSIAAGSEVSFRDNLNIQRTITLPAINVASGGEATFFPAGNGATYASAGAVLAGGAPLAGTQPVPSTIQLRTADGDVLVTIAAQNGPGDNILYGPGPSTPGEPLALLVSSNVPTAPNFTLPITNLRYTNNEFGSQSEVLIPSINLSPNATREYWMSKNGSTYQRLAGHGTTPNFDTLRRGTPITQSLVEFTATANETYYVAVDGKRLGADLASVDRGPIVVNYLPGTLLRGAFELTPLRGAPANDNILDAATLAFNLGANTGSTNADNTGATKEAAEANHAGNFGGASLWYELTPTVGGTYTVNTIDSQIDTLLAIYTAPEPRVSLSSKINQHPFGDNLMAWAFVDIDDENEEFTKENNNAAGPIAYSVDAPAGFLPDLVVDDFRISIDDTTKLVTYEIDIRNGGPQASTQANVGLWYDRDSEPANDTDADEILVVNPLAADEVQTLTSADVNLPVGDYTAWAFADSGFFVAELDETNNTRESITYLVEPKPSDKPDLTVTNIDVTDNGSDVTFDVTVANVGVNEAPASVLSFFFNPTGIPSQTTTPIDVSVNLTPIPPPALATGTNPSERTVSFTRVLDPGAYTSWAFIDQANTIMEVTDANNLRASDQYVIGAGPPIADLVVEVLQVEVGEDRATFATSVVNIGPEPSDETDVAIFFDLNTPPTSGAGADIVLTIPPLGANSGVLDGTSGVTVEYTTFDPPDGGPFTAYAYVDGSNLVPESSSTNNVSEPFVWGFPDLGNQLRPDLAFQSFTASALGGDRVQFTAIVENRGGVASDPARMGFFHHLLRPPTIDEATIATVITDVEGDAVSGGFTPGTWTGSGGNVTSTDVIASTVDSFEGDFFVQIDSSWPGDFNNHRLTYTLPSTQDWSDTPTFEYAARFLREGEEFRGEGADTIRIAPYVRDADGTEARGPSFQLGTDWPEDEGSLHTSDIQSYTIIAGGGNSILNTSQITRCGIILFGDLRLEETGVVVDLLKRSSSFQIPELLPVSTGLPQSRKTISFVREGFAPGTYKAWVYADLDEELEEAIETNNPGGAGGSGANSGISYTISGNAGASNLFATQFTLQNTGNNVTFRPRLRNPGPNPITQDFDIALYFNRESGPEINPDGSIITPPDRVLRVTDTIPVADPGTTGGEVPLEFETVVLEGGIYRPWIVIDAQNEVVESNDGDNIQRLTSDPLGRQDGTVFIIGNTQPGPNLQIALDADVANFDVTFQATTTNTGDAPSFPTQGSIIFASQAQPDRPFPADGLFEIPGLNPGESATSEFRLNGLPFGTYRSWAYTDAINAIAEGNETDNVSEEPVNFDLPNGDVMVGDLPDYFITEHILLGNSGTFTGTLVVRNINLEDATVNSRLRYVCDNADTSERYDFTVATVPPLAEGQSFTTSFQTPSLDGGTYFLRAYCDADDTIEEFSETNNSRGITDNRLTRRRGELVFEGTFYAEGAAEVAAAEEAEGARGGELGGIGGNPPTDPDYIIDTVSASVAGDGVLFAISVRNDANVDSDEWTRVGLFFDREDPPTEADEPDALVSVPPLTGESAVTVYYIRSGVPAGSYQAFAFADADDAIDEVIESNNASSSAGMVGSYMVAGSLPPGFSVEFTSTPTFAVDLEITDPTIPNVPFPDLNGQASGRTSFTRTYADTGSPVVEILVEAPAVYQGRNFVRFEEGDGTEIATQPRAFIAIRDGLEVRAVYDGAVVPVGNFFKTF